MTTVLSVFAWLVPVFLLGIPLFGAARGVPVYDAFLEGAADGFSTAIRLMPCLVAVFLAVGFLRESGALALATHALGPVAMSFGIRPDLLGLAFMRPISGSAALSIAAQIMRAFGVDSFEGRLAATMHGSSDTTLYILALYCGSVGVNKIRHTLAVGLIADLTGFIAAVIACRLAFG